MTTVSLGSCLEFVSIEALQPFPQHARKHGRAKIQSLTRSIERLGLVDPIIIDESNLILSGHLRASICAKLGHGTIQAVRVTHLKMIEKRAFVIAANRFPERGGWDRELLQLELCELLEFAGDLEIETTGFEIAEVDLLIANGPGASQQEHDTDDMIPEPPDHPARRPVGLG